MNPFDPSDKIVFLDAGAKGGIKELFPGKIPVRPFQPMRDQFYMIGIEPSPEQAKEIVDEYDELHEIGLYNKNGSADLYITARGGGTSILKIKPEAIEGIWQGVECPTPFFTETFTKFPFFFIGHPENYRVVETVSDVPLSRLDSFLDKPLDWVKADVQGVEYEVLEGAGNLLDQATAIVLEASTVEQYETQKTWKDIHEFLLERNFNLCKVDFRVYRPYEPDVVYVKDLNSLTDTKQFWSLILFFFLIGYEMEISKVLFKLCSKENGIEISEAIKTQLAEIYKQYRHSG